MASIEPATRQDREAVFRLWDSVGLGTISEPEWLAVIEGLTATLWVAREGDQVVGTAVGSFDGWRSYIYHIAVAPDRRQQGLGAALIEHSEQQLSLAGAQQIYLMVNEHNTAGLALAARAGYSPDGDIGLVKAAPPLVDDPDANPISFEWVLRASDAAPMEAILTRTGIYGGETSDVPEDREEMVAERVQAAGMHLDQGTGTAFARAPLSKYTGAAGPRRLVDAIERVLAASPCGLVVDTVSRVVEIDEHPDVGRGVIVLIEPNGSHLLRSGTSRLLLQSLRQATQVVTA